MSQARKTPPKIMVFHRQTTNDPDWEIGTFIENNAVEITSMLNADQRSTIGTCVSAKDTPGWHYAGHSLQPRHQAHSPNGSIVIYYFAWEGRSGFELDDPYIPQAKAQKMNLPGRSLIRLTNDGEFSRFAPLQDVIENFAWKDVHELAEKKLKKEVLKEGHGNLFEGEIPGSLKEWTLKSRAELVSGMEVKAEEGEAELEGDIKIKVEGLADGEAVGGSIMNSVEAVRSSEVKTEPGVSVASAPALETPSAQLDSMKTISLSRFVRLPGPIPALPDSHKRKAPESELENVQRKKKQ